jgi:hypothetical protein
MSRRIVQHAPVNVTAPPVVSTSLEPMRRDIERVADHSARQVVAEWTNPGTAAGTGATPRPPVAPGTPPAPTRAAPTPPGPGAPGAPVPGAPVHVPGLNQQAPPGLVPDDVIAFLAQHGATFTPDGATKPVLPTVARSSTPRRVEETDEPDEGEMEQQYLDILNAEHLRRQEPTQQVLDEEDRQRMRALFGSMGRQPTSSTGATGRPGSGQPAQPVREQGLTWRPGVGFVAAGSVVEQAPTGGFGNFGGSGDLEGLASFASLFRNHDKHDAAAEAADPNAPRRLSLADAIATNAIAETYSNDPAAAPLPGTAAANSTMATSTAAPAAPATTPAGAVATAGTGPVDIDRLNLEELSIRMYDHLRRRLRQELLVDRERAGLLTDYR